MTAFKEADMSYLEDLSGGDNAIIIEMIQLFLTQTPGYLKSLSAYIADKDWENTHSMAHHIKPTLAYMGAEDMRRVLLRVEQIARTGTVDEAELTAIFQELEKRFVVLFAELTAHLGVLTNRQ